MSRLIKVALIDPSPWADLFPRDDAELALLTDDVKLRGIQTPLHVCPRGDRYELLAGHDRLEAAARAGLIEVPVAVRSMLSDEDERFGYFVRDNTLRKSVCKTTIAIAVWERYPTKQVREIAAIAGVSVGTAERAKQVLETASDGLFNVEQASDAVGREMPVRRARNGRSKAKATAVRAERNPRIPQDRDGGLTPTRDTPVDDRHAGTDDVYDPFLRICDEIQSVLAEWYIDVTARLDVATTIAECNAIAKEAGLAQNIAAEIMLRCERRAGQLLSRLETAAR
jgi:ParB-like chromosome segregation protein Spo0J